MFIQKVKVLPILILFSIVVVSCSKKHDEIISTPGERALERWNALITKNWEKAYSFQSPNYRKTYSLESFRNSFGGAVEWKEIKLLSENETNESSADIELEIISLFKDGDVEMLLPGQFTEQWQKIGNTWWFFKKH